MTATQGCETCGRHNTAQAWCGVVRASFKLHPVQQQQHDKTIGVPFHQQREHDNHPKSPAKKMGPDGHAAAPKTRQVGT